MQGYRFTLAGVPLCALPSGALLVPNAGILVVGDMHLGKAERIARQGIALLPPYDTTATLARLCDVVDQIRPRTVISLGDSFDDMATANSLSDADARTLTALGRDLHWVWISGNHDPAPVAFSGSQQTETEIAGLIFRHIASSDPVVGEVSAHFHPKATLRRRGQVISRPCFLIDGARVILPAFGRYTGGLDARSSVFDALMDRASLAVLTGRKAIPVSRESLRAD